MENGKKKRVTVIGAGIAGLSAAIYAQRSGFEVTLCEQHSMAGGMCTSWKRKGYLFEGAVHWLTGSSPASKLNRIWKETGALNDEVPIILREVFSAVEWEGQTIKLFRDMEKTARHLLAVSPEDEHQIKQLVKDVKMFRHFEMPVMDIKGLKTLNPAQMKIEVLLKMLTAMPKLIKLGKLSIEEYAKRFRHRGIQTLLRIVPPEYSATSLIATLATLDSGDGGYPEGGSLGMVARMVETFEELGGKLLLNTPVKKVLVEKTAGSGKGAAQEAGWAVTGVMLENGKTMEADAVIVAQETKAALDRLFDAPLEDAWLADLYRDTRPAVCTYIGVGIRSVLPGIIPDGIIPAWKLEEPIRYAGREETEMRLSCYAGEGLAEEGCSVLTTALMGDTWDFWKKAKADGRYEEEKQALAGQIKAAICAKFPQAEGKIEVIDIATPLSYERYTGAYHGSWMSITGPGEKMKRYPGFSKNVSGLYFAGHRLMPPGGLPVALDTGRRAAQLLCRDAGALFR